MTDKAAEGNQKPRRILAPHPWPLWPEGGPAEPGSAFYLSWPGWELYLARRLNLRAGAGSPAPLLLPDAADPEKDFAYLDQLVRAAAELGAGALACAPGEPESVRALSAAIGRGGAGSPPAGPILDDRSYLALWAANEFQARQSDRLLAAAADRERAMWAALKGEDESPSSAPPRPAPEPDPRTGYAWRCWRRLAAPLLTADDLIIPTAPAAE